MHLPFLYAQTKIARSVGGRKMSPKLKVLYSLLIGLCLSLFASLLEPAISSPNKNCFCKSGQFEVYFASTRLDEEMNGYGGARHIDTGTGSIDYGIYCLDRPDDANSLNKALNGPSYKFAVRQIRQEWTGCKSEALKKYSERDFYSLLHNWDGKICVYIHGYDKSFDEAVRDIAVLCNEYNNRCTSRSQKILPVLFTWPSLNSTKDYAADECNLEWSYVPFRQFLNKLLVEKNTNSPLDIVAHSMGNRLIFWYALENAKNIQSPGIRNIFLSSADVDFHYAEQLKSEVQSLVSNVVYILVSDKDAPLLLSEYLHKQPRLGRPIDPPVAPRDAAGGFNSNSLLQLTLDAASIWLKNGLNDPPEVKQWLAEDPSLDQDFGPKAKFVDVTDVVNDEIGHGMPWSIVSGLMADPPVLEPFTYFITHKRPDRSSLINGRPAVLYKFNKIDIDNFGLRH